MKIFLAKSSQLLGSVFAASDEHRWREWQIHFSTVIPGAVTFNLLVKEFCWPIILDAPSAANPIKLSIGMAYVKDLNNYIIKDSYQWNGLHPTPFTVKYNSSLIVYNCH